MFSLLRSLAMLGCLWPLHLLAAQYPALVDGAWLSQNKTRVVVLDVRSRAEYMRGHWPDARWAGFKELPWQLTYNDIPGYLPNEKELSELLGSLGLQGSESVVVVGSAEAPARIAEATRVVWSLMIAGFQRVALVDGGIKYGVAIHVGVHDDGRRSGKDDAIVEDRDTQRGRAHFFRDEYVRLVRLAISVLIREYDDRLTRINTCALMIIEPLGQPEPSLCIAIHGYR